MPGIEERAKELLYGKYATQIQLLIDEDIPKLRIADNLEETAMICAERRGYERCLNFFKKLADPNKK